MSVYRKTFSRMPFEADLAGIVQPIEQSQVEQDLTGPVADTVKAYQGTAAIKCHRTRSFRSEGNY